MPRGTTHGYLSLDGDRLGVGGPSWSERTGLISQGAILIRDDVPDASPSRESGRLVLLHEFGHVLGLGHSEQGTHEVMVPELSGTSSGTFGGSDLFALQSLGCTRSTSTVGS